mgnify:CR=1 FL=1
MNEVPEDIATIAWLVGQSQELDASIMERNSLLVTDTGTIKQELQNYVNISRANAGGDGDITAAGLTKAMDAAKAALIKAGAAFSE